MNQTDSSSTGSATGPRRLAFASGKGGTGKTLLATNFAAWMAEYGPITYVDADVEEPNGHLFLHPETEREERFTVLHPVVQVDECTRCGACQRACAWNAILTLPDEMLVFPELCHSCGVCAFVCPQNAIIEEPRALGTISYGRSGRLQTVTGTLDIGEARATPLVAGTVEAGLTAAGRQLEPETVVVDCPPGTSCAAMAAVDGADLVILVTEPTPFGLHDLDLAVKMCRALGRPVAAVLNRADLGASDEVTSYLAAENVPLITTIPFDDGIARAYAEGHLAFGRVAGMLDAVRCLLRHVEDVWRSAGDGNEGREGAA